MPTYIYIYILRHMRIWQHPLSSYIYNDDDNFNAIGKYVTNRLGMSIVFFSLYFVPRLCFFFKWGERPTQNGFHRRCCVKKFYFYFVLLRTTAADVFFSSFAKNRQRLQLCFNAALGDKAYIDILHT